MKPVQTVNFKGQKVINLLFFYHGLGSYDMSLFWFCSAIQLIWCQFTLWLRASFLHHLLLRVYIARLLEYSSEIILSMESFFFQFKYPKFSSITHKDLVPKNMNITFLWRPAERMTENITFRFYATLIKKYDTFWLKASSNEIHVLVSAWPACIVVNLSVS